MTAAITKRQNTSTREHHNLQVQLRRSAETLIIRPSHEKSNRNEILPANPISTETFYHVSGSHDVLLTLCHTTGYIRISKTSFVFGFDISV